MKGDSPPMYPSPSEQPLPFATAESSPQIQGSVKDLQAHMAIYSNTLYGSATHALNPFADPNVVPASVQQQQPIQLLEDPPENLSLAAENVARALEDLANAHPSSAAGNEYRSKAKKFRKLAKLPKDKQRGVFSEIGRGCLLVVVAPVALAGVAVYTTGLILEGTGLVLKGIGYQGKRLFHLGKRNDLGS